MAHRKKGPRPDHGGEDWTESQVSKLERLAGATPTRLIADALGRSPGAVYQKASEESISLKPVNRSPDKRRRK